MESESPLADVRSEPLSIDECYRAVCADDKGGVCLFVGRVRDHNEGQSISALQYEAYHSMAQREMRAIIEEITAEVQGVKLACTHRVGDLRIGDLAVVCAASAPHRAEAFRACRALIDRIKERVPIWKREHGPDGPYWVGWDDARTGAKSSKSTSSKS
jgi:molybdopterin synthase catalytic subunit